MQSTIANYLSVSPAFESRGRNRWVLSRRYRELNRRPERPKSSNQDEAASLGASTSNQGRAEYAEVPSLTEVGTPPPIGWATQDDPRMNPAYEEYSIAR